MMIAGHRHGGSLRLPVFLLAVWAAVMAPRVVRAQGINLSWDDCGLSGSQIKTFACNTNTGEDVLVASFRPPSGVSQFLGLSADLRIASTQLPAWWRHGPGQCRGIGGFVTEFAGVSGACETPWSLSATGGMN